MSTDHWSDTDLARRVDGALGVAESAIALLLDTSPSIDLASLEAPTDKVVAETAMLLRSAAAVPVAVAPGVAARARALARPLSRHARHPRVAIAMALHPALALDYAAAHLALGAMGCADAAFDRQLTTARRATVAGARERVPHRALEQAWLAYLAGDRAAGAELIGRTALAGAIDLLTGSRDDVYAFTHALLYATDFGARPAPLPQPRETLLAQARSALAGALDDDDFDLAGELLLTWPLLDGDWDPVAGAAFATLAAVEDQVGLLPSLALDAAAHAQQPADARRPYAVAVTYHTAYVMGLLCATILRSPRRPSRRRTTDTHGGAAAIAPELPPADRHPQWAQILGDACPAPLLQDIALRRAVRRLDLAAVARLLARGLVQRIPASPLAVQAAELLERMSNVDVTPPAAAPPCAPRV